MLKKTLQIITVFLLLQSTSLFSQVTIGSSLPPLDGALLDIKSGPGLSTGGLGLPRVALENLSILTIDDTSPEIYVGAVVYNVTKRDDNGIAESDRLCPGIHVWDGDSWDPIIPYPKFIGVGGQPADDLVDIRNNGNDVHTYHTAYFRAFDENIENIRVNSCDKKDMDPSLMLDAGRWMTQNLRTAYFPNATSKLPEAPTWSAEAEEVDRPNIYTSRIFSNAIIDRTGIFYNWAAATNMKGGANGGGNVDNPAQSDESVEAPKRRQGICPDGWHLPSHQEYMELFEVVQHDPDAYTIERNDGAVPLSPLFAILALKDNIYGNNAPAGMRDTKGRSKNSEDGGFALEAVGYAQFWPNYYTNDKLPGQYAYFWTNSSTSRIINGNEQRHAWCIRAADNYPANDQFQFSTKFEMARDNLFSVRCKED